MGEFFNIKRLPNWLAVMVTCIGMIVISSVTLGGDSRQIEMNTKSIDKTESSIEDIRKSVNQLQIDVGIISSWVQDQKLRDEKN